MRLPYWQAGFGTPAVLVDCFVDCSELAVVRQSSSLECRLYLPNRFNLRVRHARRALHRHVPGVGMEDMLRRAKHGILSLLLVWVRAACRCNPANPSRSVLAAMQLGDAANGLRPCLTVGSFEPQHAPSQI